MGSFGAQDRAPGPWPPAPLRPPANLPAARALPRQRAASSRSAKSRARGRTASASVAAAAPGKMPRPQRGFGSGKANLHGDPGLKGDRLLHQGPRGTVQQGDGPTIELLRQPLRVGTKWFHVHVLLGKPRHSSSTRAALRAALVLGKIYEAQQELLVVQGDEKPLCAGHRGSPGLQQSLHMVR